MRRAASLLAQAALPVLTRLDPEFAHGMGLKGLEWLKHSWPAPRFTPALARSCFGINFAHPVGLAAGFDKNGDHLDALGAIGFSHVELGTVTPRPQPGNPRPRMFRLRGECALINRMGFNNKGVAHLIGRLQQSRYAGVRGVSIGKNADTPLERAHEDYLACFNQVYPLADYIAVNISSPNTRGLRDLQARAALQRIVEPLLEARLEHSRRHGRQVPLLVKIAPDLADEALDELAQGLAILKLDGIIATNTTIGHSILKEPPDPPIQGGLSGAPLHPRSVHVIARLRAALGPAFPIIGVGGIVDAARARATLDAGADLIQLYTGFAYRGGKLVRDILGNLSS
jgi:dihydroorotate dehydrogenase